MTRIIHKHQTSIKDLADILTSTEVCRVRSCRFQALIVKSSPALYKYDLPTANVCT